MFFVRQVDRLPGQRSPGKVTVRWVRKDKINYSLR